MNDATKQHFRKAREYVAKGDEFYGKAADELIAANVGQPNGPTWTAAAAEIGKSDQWVRRLVTSRTNFDAGVEEGFQVDWERGSHGTKAEIREGVKRLAATDPSIVTEILDTMPEEQREMVAQEIAQREDFAEAVKSNEVVRDTLILGVLGTEEQQQEKRDEAHRSLIAKHPMFGWGDVSEGLTLAIRGVSNGVNALVKLAINSRVSQDDDVLQVARGKAEDLGHRIHELEMAWGETPISDAIEELRPDRV